MTRATGAMAATMRWVLVLAVTAAIGCASAPVSGSAFSDDGFTPERGRTDVRVALDVAVATVAFEATAAVEVLVDGRRRAFAAGQHRASVRNGRLVLTGAGADVLTEAREIRLTARGEAPWRFGRDRFAGDMVVRRNDDGTVTLINHLPIETYLRGVVPWEIGRPERAAFQAVVAQAIAARTYTYARLGRWEALGFDVYADIRDQVYRGLSGTAEICDDAVRASAFDVAVHDGELIRAYYSSTDGGHTSTLVDVWTREGAPYLIGRRDADANGRSWCSGSPHFRWTEVWSARELGDIVRVELPRELGRTLEPEQIGRLQRLRVVARDGSGRVQRLRIETDVDAFEVWGDRIRWVLRPIGSNYPILRSTMFDVENVVRDGVLVGVVLRGGGFGHGVGMCQTGALARARAGQSAETILRAYYDGVEVRDVRSLPGMGIAR